MTRIINNPHFKDSNLIDFSGNSEELLIQFDKWVSEKYLINLNQIIAQSSYKITVRFFSYNGLWKDLTFLKPLTNVESLVLDEPFIETIEPIASLKKIKELSIGQTSKNIDLTPLRVLNLENLTIEKSNKNLEILLNSTFLKNLNLWNINLNKKQCKILEKKHFENLTLNNVKAASYQFLGSIKVENKINLYRMNNLKTLDFLNNFKDIKEINLAHLNKIERLFDFNNKEELKIISMDGMKKLTDLSNINEAVHLKKIYLYNCPNIPLSQIKKILNFNLESDMH
ncbi:MAG: hypothetical protein Q8O88_04770 [bacterium]|nr:hypothetical protein [bacterium]